MNIPLVTSNALKEVTDCSGDANEIKKGPRMGISDDSSIVSP